jgi:hypothetical protein
MRSSRRTTTPIAETSVVDASTDVSHMGLTLATFLEDASIALRRHLFYLIQTNGWQSLPSLCLVVQAGCRLASHCPLILPPSRRLVAPAGCRIASHRPLIAPPSPSLVAPAGCCVASSCAALSSSLLLQHHRPPFLCRRASARDRLSTI